MLLADQDRTRWDRGRIAEGLALLRGLAGAAGRAVPLQAAIAAVHAEAPTAADTDWAADRRRCTTCCWTVAPSPVVALNRAVAVADARRAGGRAGRGRPLELPGYHLFHATRADLLGRLGRPTRRRPTYEAALELASNAADRDLLRRRLTELPR